MDERLTPRAREILVAARALLDSEGLDALSMRNLAERLGIRAPSIYKHFSGKDALAAALISEGFEEQAAQFAVALATAEEPVIAMGEAYREFARTHPALYRLMYDRELDRSLLTPGSEDAAAALVVRAFGGDGDLARAAFAFAHGMMVLELNDRFPPGADLDAAWQRGLAALQASIPARRRRKAR